MLGRSVIAVLAAVLLAASDAGAAEQQLSADQSYGISAISDWVS